MYDRYSASSLQISQKPITLAKLKRLISCIISKARDINGDDDCHVANKADWKEGPIASALSLSRWDVSDMKASLFNSIHISDVESRLSLSSDATVRFGTGKESPRIRETESGWMIRHSVSQLIWQIDVHKY